MVSAFVKKPRVLCRGSADQSKIGSSWIIFVLLSISLYLISNNKYASVRIDVGA